MDFTDIRIHNPRLFYDGICRRKIPYSNLTYNLQTGQASSNPIIEPFLGGPKPPVSDSFDPATTDIIGPSGYPKPWRSGSQFLQDASYGSTIGPFARMVGLPKEDNLLFPNTCKNGSKPNQCGGAGGVGIWGRIGIGAGPDYEYLGFRSQDWYHQSEGTWNTEFWNNTLDPDPAWPTWKEWWDNASKATITATWAEEGMPIKVQVAYDSPEYGDPDYWPGAIPAVFALGTFNLLASMVAVAAIIRW